ncbi:hypothetical protein ACFVT2_34675 [Streptomyces sp. NPDC058000]|uniref:hypothetical protein n=1 Tax=Streptomyces sp. NPDC058000 TaxID=3346299 RepID=UPI0036EFDF5C
MPVLLAWAYGAYLRKLLSTPPKWARRWPASATRSSCARSVLRAHRIGSGLWADLVHLHRTTHADLVLVHHAELPDGLAHLLRHCDHRVIETLAGMEKLHPPAAASAKSWSGGRGWCSSGTR